MGKGESDKKAPSAKTREKLNNATLFRPESYQKFLTEVPKGRVITPAAVSDKFKISASLARKALRDMARQKMIKRVISHTGLYLYSRTDEQIKLADEKAALAAKQEEAQAAKKAAAAAKGGKAAAPAAGAAAAAAPAAAAAAAPAADKKAAAADKKPAAEKKAPAAKKGE